MPRPFPALTSAPAAARNSTVTTVHGVDLHDDYGWLRADLTAENAYYDAAMADTADLQARLVVEMRGRIKEDDSSVPRENGTSLAAPRSRPDPV